MMSKGQEPVAARTAPGATEYCEWNDTSGNSLGVTMTIH